VRPCHAKELPPPVWTKKPMSYRIGRRGQGGVAVAAGGGGGAGVVRALRGGSGGALC
jgi:hypothetical protein